MHCLAAYIFHSTKSDGMITSHICWISADPSDWSIEAFLGMMRAAVQNYFCTPVTFVSITAVLKCNYEETAKSNLGTSKIHFALHNCDSHQTECCCAYFESLCPKCFRQNVFIFFLHFLSGS